MHLLTARSWSNRAYSTHFSPKPTLIGPAIESPPPRHIDTNTKPRNYKRVLSETNTPKLDSEDKVFEALLIPHVTGIRKKKSKTSNDESAVNPKTPKQIMKEEVILRHGLAVKDLIQAYGQYTPERVMEAVHMASGYMWMARLVLDSGFNSHVMFTAEHDDIIYSNDSDSVNALIREKGFDMYHLRCRYLVGYSNADYESDDDPVME